jgi:hypothetical protein
VSQQYAALVDRLFSDASDRAIAQAFVQKFEGTPFSDRLIPAMLQEGAAMSARIVAGELTPEAGREALASFVAEGYGIPAHVISDVTAWTNSNLIPDDGTQPAPEPRGAEPPSRYSDLINRLFIPEERAAAHALAKYAETRPQLAMRTEAILHEIAKGTDLDRASATSFITDFCAKIGVPSYEIGGLINAIGAPVELAREQQVLHELTGDLSPQAQHAITKAEREKALSEMSVHEKNMRAPQGSPEWAAYWRDPAAQAAYHDAISRSLVEPPVTPAAAPPAAPAPEPAAPAPAAEPAAPPVQPGA